MDCLVIYRVGDHGREGLCDPEGVPDTGRAHAAGKSNITGFLICENVLKIKKK